MPMTLRTILIVDDAVEDRVLLRRLLARNKEYQYQFIEADKGTQALELCRLERPDCVLLDYHLPDSSGTEILQAIVAEFGLNNFPIVMLSGNSEFSMAVAALHIGAQDFLIKDHLSAEVLHRAVSNAIEKVALHKRQTQAEQEMRESAARYQLALTAGRMGTWETDFVTKIRTWSKEGMALFGLALVDGRGQVGGEADEYRLALHPDDRHLVQQFHELADKQDSFAAEYRIVRPDGTNLWLAGRGLVAARGPDGKAQRLVSIMADVTEPKMAEDKVRVSEIRYRRLFEAAHDGVLLLDPDTCKITDANPFMTRLLGYSHDQLVGKELFEIGLLRDEAASQEMFQKLKKEHQVRYEDLPLQSQQGQHQQVEVVANLYEEDGHLVIQCNIRDITERKQTEQKLRMSEERLRMAAQTSGFGIHDYDAVNKISTWSPELFDICGIELGTPITMDVINNLNHPDDRERIDKAIQVSLDPSGTGEFVEEVRILRADTGEIRWLNNRGQTFFAGDGRERRAIRNLGVVIDITDRKRTELNLAFLADVLKDLTGLISADEVMRVAGTRIASYLNLSSCVFVEINTALDEALVIYDHHPVGAPGLVGSYRLADFHTAQERQQLNVGQKIVIQDVRHGPRSVEAAGAFEALGIRALVTVPYISDGEWKFALSAQRALPYQWRKDESELMFELAAQIYVRLERARAEEALRKSEDRFRALFNSIDEGFCIIEMIFDAEQKPVDYRFMQANPALERLTGLTGALGKTARELVPDLEAFWFETYGKVALTGEAVRFENKSESMNRWFDVYASRIGDAPSSRVAIVFNNITERKQAEEQIRRANERFRIAEEASNGFIYDLDRATEVEVRSDGFTKVLGYTNGEFPKGGTAWETLIHPDDVAYVRSATETLFASYETKAQIEYRLHHKDGRWVWVMDEYLKLHDEQGNIQRVVGSIVDITERKQSELALHESETRLRQLADAMPQIVWSNDVTGWVNYLNQQWFDYTGLSLDESLRNPNAPIHPEDRQVAEAAWAKNLALGEMFEYELRLRRRDGAYRWHLARCVSTRDATGQIVGWYGTSTDIHERMQAELNARYLADLGQHFASAADAVTLIETITRLTGKHFGASRCVLSEIDLERDVASVRNDYHAADLIGVAGEHKLTDFISEDVADYAAGRTVIRNDVRTNPRTAKTYETAFAPLNIRATLVVPLMRAGHWVASLAVMHHEMHDWTNDEIVLLRMVAERTWLAIENIRLQAETQALNSTLEQRVTERTLKLRESQTQLRKLSAYTDRMREDERTRIAREVHDQLGGSLTGLKMSLARVTKGRDADVDLATKVQNMSDQVDKLVQMVRRVASDLRPPLLDDFGLVAALEWQAQEWEKQTGIQCDLTLLSQEVALDRERRTAVFRVFQESLTNIARHAHATQVDVNLQSDDKLLLLVIHDNGNGIAAETLRLGKSLGLMGMHERMREVNGELEIQGVPGEGTTVTIRLALN